MEYEVQGARPRGRPKKTWRQIVKKTVRHIKMMPWIIKNSPDREMRSSPDLDPDLGRP